MKIAIIHSGPYRGNENIMQNQLNMIGAHDTYVSCLEHYREDWIRSNWPVKEIFITPNVNFNETDWSKQRNDAPGQSGFWQFWNLKKGKSRPRQVAGRGSTMTTQSSSG